ncbi:MAG: DUF1007 family protein [Spirochaetales bacterium]|nr:DUF1007 family protein [Spirochaetales bacterium]
MVKVNKKKIRISRLDNFTVSSEQSIVSYSFSFPLDIPFDGKSQIEIIFNDETIYTAFDINTVVQCNESVMLDNLRIQGHSYYGVRASFDIRLMENEKNSTQ